MGQCMFSNTKTKRLYMNKKKPAKIAWTVDGRRALKKGQTSMTVQKKKKITKKKLIRSYATASLEVITKRRNESLETRKLIRESAIALVKSKKKSNSSESNHT